MKIILLQDIDKLGKKYEVREVAAGFARNHLIPKGLAKIADEANLKWLEKEKEIIQKQVEEELQKVQDLASMIDGLEVTIAVKVGEEGQLFESITAWKISEKLKEMGFEIAREQIRLAEPIKELGEFPVKISFEHNLEADIRVIVIEEK